MGFNPTREGRFRDEDLSPYPADTPVKAITLGSKDERSDSTLCEGRIGGGELSDGDKVFYADRKFCWFVVKMHSVYSFTL